MTDLKLLHHDWWGAYDESDMKVHVRVIEYLQ